MALDAANADRPDSLTPKRISRLLRRVRVSCKALQQYYAKPLRHKATYAAHPTDAPLAVIPPPSAITSRLLFDQGHEAKAELSQRVYAVANAFRDLVINTAREDANDSPSSLAALCAIVIGGNMNQPASDGNLSDDERVGEDDDWALLYEAVPCQYRRWSVISHASHTILETCPPHPTLYRILLDVALGQELHYESEIFLKALLNLSFASSEHDPYICHPLHSRFLLDLRAAWLVPPSTHTSDRLFLRVLQVSLSETPSLQVWNSRAFDLLLQFITKRDTQFLFDVSYNLLERLAQAGNYKISVEVGEKTSTWLTTYILPNAGRFLVQCTDLVQHVYQLGIQRMPWHRNLMDSLTSITTLILSESASDSTIAFLRAVEPDPSTFVSLVTHIFRISESPLAEKTRFAKCATALSNRGLLRLEASLWRCIIAHVDGLYRHDAAELPGYHEELEDVLEDAEQRCFGSISDKKYHWDPIGCWVRSEETPRPRKRQKLMEESDHGRKVSGAQFVSLLYRAASTRVVLHPDSPADSPATSPQRFADTSLSSDDALDMFTYLSSP